MEHRRCGKHTDTDIRSVQRSEVVVVAVGDAVGGTQGVDIRSVERTEDVVVAVDDAVGGTQGADIRSVQEP